MLTLLLKVILPNMKLLLLFVITFTFVNCYKIIYIKPEETTSIYICKNINDLEVIAYSDNKIKFDITIWANDTMVSTVCENCLSYKGNIYLNKNETYTMKITNRNMFYDNTIVYDFTCPVTSFISFMVIIILLFSLPIGILFVTITLIRRKKMEVP